MSNHIILIKHLTFNIILTMKSRFRHLVLGTVAAIIAVTSFSFLFSSCSKEDDNLLDNVPYNSKVIATVNLDLILKNAGCQFRDGTILLSNDLAVLRDRYFQDRSTAVNMVLLTASTVDLKKVVIYQLDNLDPVLTFRIKNKDIFTALATGAAGKMESIGKFDVFELEKCVIMTSGNIGWLSSSVTNIEKSLAPNKGKKHEGFNNAKNIIDSSDKAVAMAINLHQSIDAAPDNGVVQYFKNTWVIGEVNLADNILGLSFKAIDRGGEALDISPYIGEIDPDFLRYTPDNTQLLFTIGSVNGIDELYTKIRTALSPEVRESIDRFLPYIKEIDGTTSVAVNPVATGSSLTDFSLDTWDATIMTHLPQHSVDGIVTMIGHLGTLTGQAPSDDEQPSFTIGDKEVFYGNYDGYLAFSTRPISADYNNSFTTVVLGSRALLMLDIPYKSETMKAFDLPFGFYMSLRLENTSLNGRLKFNGTNAPFLSALASAMVSYARANPLPDIVTETVTDEYHDDSMIEDELQPL